MQEPRTIMAKVISKYIKGGGAEYHLIWMSEGGTRGYKVVTRQEYEGTPLSSFIRVQPTILKAVRTQNTIAAMDPDEYLGAVCD